MEETARQQNAHDFWGPFCKTVQAWNQMVAPDKAPDATAGKPGKTCDANSKSKNLEIVKKLDQLFWRFIETLGEIER